MQGSMCDVNMGHTLPCTPSCVWPSPPSGDPCFSTVPAAEQQYSGTASCPRHQSNVSVAVQHYSGANVLANTGVTITAAHSPSSMNKKASRNSVTSSTTPTADLEQGKPCGVSLQ